MKKLFLLCLMLALFVCALTICVSADGIDYSEKVILDDGTELPIYDENQNSLIWFIYSTDENGVKTYKSVAANRDKADNATSYITYNINSTYGTNQMHDAYINYWDEATGSYVSFGEGTIVVANFSSLEREYWSIGTVFSSDNLEYLYHSSTVRSAGRLPSYTKLKLIDCSLATNYTDFAEQAYKGCTALKEFRFGAGTYELSCKNGNLFGDCTSLSKLVFAEGATITAIGSTAFYNCKSLTGTYSFPDCTSIGTQAFRYAATNEGTTLILSFPSLVVLGASYGDTHVFSNSGVEELYFGDDITDMSHNTFSNCSKLRVVEFAGIGEGFTFKSYTFENCTALESFSIPEGITELPSRMFKNCSSLTAVYLPSTLTAINSGDNDHATFKGCKNLYFVDKPFTKDNIPSEPEVYYFPSGLVTVTSEAFDGSRVNDVVVFPSKLVSLTSGYTFEGSTSKSGNPTVIFMGDMEAVSVKSWGVSKIYFANKNDVDASSAGYTGSVAAVYCFGEGNTEHICEKTLSTEATCEMPKMIADYCFCGTIIGTPNTEGEALGHNYTGKVTYEFVSLTQSGTKFTECVNNCGKPHTEALKPVYVELGYSVKEFGQGGVSFTSGYMVNTDMLKLYQEEKGVSLEFGMAFNAAQTFTTDEEISLDSFKQKTTVASENKGVMFSCHDYVITYKDNTNLDKDLVIAAYVIQTNGDGEESLIFINRGDGEINGFEGVSYNKALAWSQAAQ